MAVQPSSTTPVYLPDFPANSSRTAAIAAYLSYTASDFWQRAPTSTDPWACLEIPRVGMQASKQATAQAAQRAPLRKPASIASDWAD